MLQEQSFVLTMKRTSIHNQREELFQRGKLSGPSPGGAITPWRLDVWDSKTASLSMFELHDNR